MGSHIHKRRHWLSPDGLPLGGVQQWRYFKTSNEGQWMVMLWSMAWTVGYPVLQIIGVPLDTPWEIRSYHGQELCVCEVGERWLLYGLWVEKSHDSDPVYCTPNRSHLYLPHMHIHGMFVLNQKCKDYVMSLMPFPRVHSRLGASVHF